MGNIERGLRGKTKFEKNVLETSDDGLRLYERKIYLHSKIADFLLFGEMEKNKEIYSEQKNVLLSQQHFKYFTHFFNLFFLKNNFYENLYIPLSTST